MVFVCFVAERYDRHRSLSLKGVSRLDAMLTIRPQLDANMPSVSSTQSKRSPCRYSKSPSQEAGRQGSSLCRSARLQLHKRLVASALPKPLLLIWFCNRHFDQQVFLQSLVNRKSIGHRDFVLRPGRM